MTSLSSCKLRTSISIFNFFLDSIKTEPITIYHIGDEWWDLCAGPHVESTGKLDQKAFELESVAGAYWRGDETKPMLQRIYGTAWETPEQLQAYNDFKFADGSNGTLSTDMVPTGRKWLTSKYTSTLLAMKLNMMVVITTWLPR